MPRIPLPVIQQQQTTTSSAGPVMMPERSFQTNDVAQGLSDLGRAAIAIADEDGRAWASKTASDDQLKWMTRMQEAQAQAQPGAPGFTEGMLSEFNDYRTKALAAAPASARRFYEAQLNQLGNYVGTNSISWQAQQHRANTVSQYQQGADADAAAVSLDPSLYDDRRAARMAALSVSNLPPDVRATLASRSDGALAYAAGSSMVDMDPHGSLDAFTRAGKGEATAGYDWISRLQAPQIEVLRRRAQSQVTALDNRAQLAQDRAEAKGARAIAEYDAQINSGVPAPPDKMIGWLGAAAGTVYEQDMKDRMEAEQQVQEVLRMPIADQEAFIAQRAAHQRTNGASLTDQANLRRLTTAVAQNVKTLQETPLVYAAQRIDAQVAPLDLQTAFTPEGAAAIGPQLRDRVTTIQALQRQNPPGTVSMRPLLPAEADALGEALNQGSAAEKSGLLGTLYRAFGDPVAYQGAMAQIDAKNPFMARMGQRAASYAQAQLTNNWVSADVVQSAGDVAAIALHGDDILKAGGKAGAEKFPIPKDQEFMTALQAKLTDLYRGTGPGSSDAAGYMNDAYAIKAYYVGRAAQQGDITGQVDSDRMDQAITAVLGAPVNFHGNGQVLAPWGMSADDFTTRATGRLAQLFQAAGVQDKVGQHMGNVGLIGAGGGVYFPTLAGTPIADDQGRPLVLRLTPDEDAGRDSFGRKLSDQIPKDMPK
ncbi:hypothetical protein [Achromobacter sp. K91]|uniref:hypothetical protein n=1 Tax=Achromobacter sp. K91 TaxID=2292262 RepID=UPI0011C38FAA|nr:hypothetical protein [Achromobacter sp. K91]